MREREGRRQRGRAVHAGEVEERQVACGVGVAGNRIRAAGAIALAEGAGGMRGCG